MRRELSYISSANLGTTAGGGWRQQAQRRCRYTEWLEGTHVEFTAFPWERRELAAAGGPPAAAPERDGGDGEAYDEVSSSEEDDDDAWVLLKRLRHPLLHGWYLERLAAWRKQQARPHACIGLRPGPPCTEPCLWVVSARDVILLLWLRLCPPGILREPSGGGNSRLAHIPRPAGGVLLIHVRGCFSTRWPLCMHARRGRCHGRVAL